MSGRGHGEAVPSVSGAAQRAWYVFKHYHAASARDPRISYLSGYQRCAADMLVDMFELGGWDTLTRRLLEVLEQLAVEREAVRLTTAEVVDGNVGD